MSDRPTGAKYTSVHRDLQLEDIRSHLAGALTVGGYLTLADDRAKSLAICFDGDGPETFMLLVEACGLLQKSGAIPILERCALPEGAEHAGGGKLWLAFSEPLDWRAAHATALATAPALAALERFPGSSRVRLPGGVYRRGLNLPCGLKVIGRSNWLTGESAARALMENPTPASLVEEDAPLQPDGGELPRKAPILAGPIPLHRRNQTLIRLAGAMRRIGASQPAILAALAVENESRCEAPLDGKELEDIAASASCYAPVRADRDALMRVRPAEILRRIG
jgi:hypothetical protein